MSAGAKRKKRAHEASSSPPIMSTETRSGTVCRQNARKEPNIKTLRHLRPSLLCNSATCSHSDGRQGGQQTNITKSMARIMTRVVEARSTNKMTISSMKKFHMCIMTTMAAKARRETQL